MATHSCSVGFSLVGEANRTCEDDNQLDTEGVWSGSPASCQCKLSHLQYIILPFNPLHKNVQL